LAASDEASFCDWASQQFAVSAVCRYQGVVAAGKNTGALQERRDACAAGEQRCLRTVTSQLATTCREDWLTDTCEATAEELTQCMKKLAQNYATALSGVPACSMLEQATEAAPLDLSTLLMGCEAAKAKCPSLLGPNGGSGDPDPNTPAVITSCEATRDAYEASCGTPSSASCSILRSVYGEACDVQGARFYDCAKSASFDCAMDDLSLGIKGCAVTLNDYVTCHALDGVTCKREPGLDTRCEDKAGTPYATRCVSDAVPADCVPALGAYYCCPSE
jgi:hypothetical protein